VDWRAWARAFTGGVDGRRIELVGTADEDEIPGGLTCAGAVGEAIVTGMDGVRRNGWTCIDWVCGECSGDFAPAE
jgi:hypothetical protein